MSETVDLAQIKYDMENGIMVCRETFRKAIEYALELEHILKGLEK